MIGERTVYVACHRAHTIAFDDDGRLTLTGSVGSKADPSHNRPGNWCHFFVKAGESEICGDAKCRRPAGISRHDGVRPVA